MMTNKSVIIFFSAVIVASQILACAPQRRTHNASPTKPAATGGSGEKAATGSGKGATPADLSEAAKRATSTTPGNFKSDLGKSEANINGVSSISAVQISRKAEDSALEVKLVDSSGKDITTRIKSDAKSKGASNDQNPSIVTNAKIGADYECQIPGKIIAACDRLVTTVTTQDQDKKLVKIKIERSSYRDQLVVKVLDGQLENFGSAVVEDSKVSVEGSADTKTFQVISIVGSDDKIKNTLEPVKVTKDGVNIEIHVDGLPLLTSEGKQISYRLNTETSPEFENGEGLIALHFDMTVDGVKKDLVLSINMNQKAGAQSATSSAAAGSPINTGTVVAK